MQAFSPTGWNYLNLIAEPSQGKLEYMPEINLLEIRMRLPSRNKLSTAVISALSDAKAKLLFLIRILLTSNGHNGAAQLIWRMLQFFPGQVVLGIPQLPVKLHHPFQIVKQRRPHPLLVSAVSEVRHAAAFFAAGA